MRQLVADGAIGTPAAGNVYFCTGRLWFRRREEGWSDAEYMARNWVSFTETSGDHIVEQHVHTIDMANWVLGAHPVAAAGFGGRHRRQTGNQFDFFSIDFEYPERRHVHSTCRQISGCWNWGNGIHVVGEKGTAGIRGGVVLWDGTKPPAPDLGFHKNVYVQEHVALLKSLLAGKPINDTEAVTDATLSAILGRISAYTGQRIEWRHLADPKAGSPLYNLACTPSAEDFERGDLKAPPDGVAPIPGKG
jgi:predicted dehydrogenase